EDDAPEVDTGELGSVIEEAEAVSEEDRSPGLQSALENAKSTIENDDADQQQMDEAEAALSSAIKSNEEEMEDAGEESEEESTEEAAEESSQEEETTEEPASEETEESKEEQSIEETEAESETGSSQAEASKDNTFMILLSAVLVILAIIAAILIWKRKK